MYLCVCVYACIYIYVYSHMGVCVCVSFTGDPLVDINSVGASCPPTTFQGGSMIETIEAAKKRKMNAHFHLDVVQKGREAWLLTGAEMGTGLLGPDPPGPSAVWFGPAAGAWRCRKDFMPWCYGAGTMPRTSP